VRACVCVYMHVCVSGVCVCVCVCLCVCWSLGMFACVVVVLVVDSLLRDYLLFSDALFQAVIVISATRGTILKEFVTGEPSVSAAMAWSPHNPLQLAFGTAGFRIRIIDVSTCTCVPVPVCLCVCVCVCVYACACDISFSMHELSGMWLSFRIDAFICDSLPSIHLFSLSVLSH
jgi:hypothetical protein